jgi:RimJ/RimL family protein N-acetyltransferase
MFNFLKNAKDLKLLKNKISINYKNKNIFLLPIGLWIFLNKKLIRKINLKRFQYNNCFLSNISKDVNKTNKYLNFIIKNKNICFFLINSDNDSYDGIIGLKKNKHNLEIYFVLKLTQNQFMRIALKRIIKWANSKFKIRNFTVRLLSNNLRAKKLYYDCGFNNSRSYFLKKKKINKLYKHFIANKEASNVEYKYQTLSLKI